MKTTDSSRFSEILIKYLYSIYIKNYKDIQTFESNKLHCVSKKFSNIKDHRKKIKRELIQLTQRRFNKIIFT